jgi:uncharacterized membrane protein YfcA
MPFPVQLLVLFLVGVLCGFINILAGGGSLLTLPVLIFLGLPAAVANGTNRIGILIQNIAAVFGFHQQNVFPWRVSLLAALPAVFGAVIGAQLALDVPDDLFKRLLAGIMIGVLLIIVLDPAKRLRAERKRMTWWRGVLFAAGFFGVGLFGGFIQAGVGFLIILLMLLEGFDLVQINAVKVFVVFIFTIAALAVFIYHQQVNYVLGGILGVGNALGGWLATRFAVKKGHDWIRGFVIVTVIVFSIQLLIDSFR